MTMSEKTATRLLFTIAEPRLAEKAIKIFNALDVAVAYELSAVGTASSEMMDILGLGTPDKALLISILPKPDVDVLLKKLNKDLRLGTVNSGIAFTLPVSGANSFLLKILGQSQIASSEKNGKVESAMNKSGYSMITVAVNQGFSEEVMNAARAAGAGGGTVVHSRRLGSEESLAKWGLTFQEEKELVFIVAKDETKLQIMQAIGDNCGLHSEAGGLIFSLPIDNVIGINED